MYLRISVDEMNEILSVFLPIKQERDEMITNFLKASRDPDSVSLFAFQQGIMVHLNNQIIDLQNQVDRLKAYHTRE